MATVRQLTGCKQDEGAAVDGVTAESLNDHYAAISTDHSYTPPHRHQYTATDVETEYMSTNGASLTYWISYILPRLDLMAFQRGS